MHVSPSSSLPDDPHLADDISQPGGDGNPAEDMAHAPDPMALTNAGQHVAGVVSGGVAQHPGSGGRQDPTPRTSPRPADRAESRPDRTPRPFFWHRQPRRQALSTVTSAPRVSHYPRGAPTMGTPGRQLLHRNLRLPLGSVPALLRHICLTGYTPMRHSSRMDVSPRLEAAPTTRYTKACTIATCLR